MAVQMVPSMVVSAVNPISSLVSLSAYLMASIMVLPEPMRAVDGAIRSDFHAWRHMFFFWFMAATFVVLLGVALEEVEEIRWLKRHCGVKFAKRAAKTGWFLILIGVLGEGVFEAYTTKADGWIDDLNTSLLAGSQKEADENGLAAAYASERAADAEKGAANAEKEVANATRRAAEATRAAEREKIERLKLDAQIAPRRLTSKQQFALLGTCTSFPYRRVVVASYMSDTESTVLASQILSALNCNPKRFFVDNKVASQLAVGVLFGIQIKGDDESLVNALKDDLSPMTFVPDSVIPPHTLVSPGTGGGATPPSATILVGAKPL